MPLSTDVGFLSCSVAGDGPEGAILVMRHWRVCGDTPQKAAATSIMEKSPKQGKNSAFRGGTRCGLLHFECPSTKVGSHTVAQGAASCEALSG